MLEKSPTWPRPRPAPRPAGYEKITAEDDAFALTPDSISLKSPAFADGGDIPGRFHSRRRADIPATDLARRARRRGEPGADHRGPRRPSAEPLVHLLAWDLPPDLTSLDEGLFRSPHHEGLDENLGRNSFLQTAHLPPDPPTGHGPHLYAFQIFALDRKLVFDHRPADRPWSRR